MALASRYDDSDMIPAKDIADYLCFLASEEAEYEPMTHLRLQKLLYYVQGWSLAIRGNPVFSEPIEAWKDGPVVPEVYQVFKDFGAAPIPAPPRTKLPDDIAGFVRSIWEAHKQYSATALRAKTHNEETWSQARRGLPSGASSSEEITHEAMILFFTKEFNRKQFGELTIDRFRKSEEDFGANRGTRFGDIRAKYAV